MVTNTQVSIHDLLRDLTISDSQLARDAKVDIQVISRLRSGGVVRRASANKVLRVLSREYGQDYSLNNVRDVNLG